MLIPFHRQTEVGECQCRAEAGEFHRRAEAGDRCVIDCIKENAINLINRGIRIEFNKFYELWKQRVEFWAMQCLEKWKWLCEQKGASIEELLPSVVQDTFVRVSRFDFEIRGYRELKGYIFITVRAAVIDIIREEIFQRFNITPGRIIEAMMTCSQESYQEQLAKALEIFNSLEQYERLLKIRGVSARSITDHSAHRAEYLLILRYTMEGRKPSEIAKLMNRDVNEIYKLKRLAILEIWSNICYDQRFADLKRCIAVRLDP